MVAISADERRKAYTGDVLSTYIPGMVVREGQVLTIHSVGASAENIVVQHGRGEVILACLRGDRRSSVCVGGLFTHPG